MRALCGEMLATTYKTLVLYLNRTLQCLSLLLGPGDGFLSHNTSAPVTLGFLILLRVAFLDR